MPIVHDIQSEIHHAGHNTVRMHYAEKLRSITNRNIVWYYSGWLQKPEAPGIDINDLDMSAFMSVINGLDREKGLDLILHTPGGNIAATEALVNYLRAMFGANIRVIVPQLALSAGTMIACAAQSVLMGKHSFLGPIDPQIDGISAHRVVQEFERAYTEIKDDSAKTAVWQPIIAKYRPTFILQCEQWIEWSNDMARQWLETGMLKGNPQATDIAQDIVKQLTDNALTKSHNRHLSAEYCREIGMVVETMEGDQNQELQDAVLSLHHACMLTLMGTTASKIIENHKSAYVMQTFSRQLKDVKKKN